jgi:hypothetical protein
MAADAGGRGALREHHHSRHEPDLVAVAAYEEVQASCHTSAEQIRRAALNREHIASLRAPLEALIGKHIDTILGRQAISVSMRTLSHVGQTLRLYPVTPARKHACRRESLRQFG